MYRIINSTLADAIPVAGIYREFNQPIFFDSADPLVSQLSTTTSWEKTIDFSMFETRESMRDVIDNNVLGAHVDEKDFDRIPKAFLLSLYFSAFLKVPGHDNFFKGYFPYKPVKPIVLVNKELEWSLEIPGYETVISNDVVSDIVDLAPSIVVSWSGSVESFVTWGQFQGPLKAWCSPFFFAVENGNIDRVNWGNLYTVGNKGSAKDEFLVSIATAEVLARIEYKNDYKKFIKEKISNVSK